MNKEGLVNASLRVARVARNLSPAAAIPMGIFGLAKGFDVLNTKLEITNQTEIAGLNVGGLEFITIAFGPFVAASLLSDVIRKNRGSSITMSKISSEQPSAPLIF